MKKKYVKRKNKTKIEECKKYRKKKEERRKKKKGREKQEKESRKKEIEGLVWFVWVLWHISLYWLFNAKSIFILINCSIWNNTVYHKYTV